MREFTLWLIRGGLIYIGRSEDLKILEKSEENLIKNLSRISLFLSRIRELEKYLYLGLIRDGLIYIGRSGDLKILEKSEIKSFKNLSRILFLLSRIRELENYFFCMKS